MVLSDRDIKRALEIGRIKILPKPNLAETLGPCSIDFHLGSFFKVFQHTKHAFIDVKNLLNSEKMMEEIKIDRDEPFILRPGELVLATTEESLELGDDILGRIEGRSSLGRLGVVVHSTAARVDPGWVGKPAMELGNIGVMPVALYPGMKICSFTFEYLSSPVEVMYKNKPGAKYAGEAGPVASKIGEEFRGKVSRVTSQVSRKKRKR